jgi:hypothetical protein
MQHAELIQDLRNLAADAASAADRVTSIVQLSQTYAQLHHRVQRLNERHSWATAEEFATQLPTIQGLATIERLDVAMGAVDPSHSDVSVGAIRLADALRQLSGWATGVRMAYETLELDVENRG